MMKRDIEDYSLDIRNNYTDLFILLNTKEKMNDFVNHLVMFLVKKYNEDKREKGDDFFPSFIHNEKGKSIEVDYNFMVLALQDWVKELEYKDYKSVLDKFKYNIEWGLSSPSNASIFLTAFVFGMHHRMVRTGLTNSYGVMSQSHLFCIPIVFESIETGKKVKYFSVSFFLKKINGCIEDNEFKEEFEKIITSTASEYKQVAYGSKNTIEFCHEEDVAIYCI